MKTKIMDEILNKPFKNSVCPRCGNAQTHSLRWCKADGAEFVYIKNGTLLDAIKFANNRDFQNIRLGCLRPDYVSAVCKSKLRAYNISCEEFTKYILDKIGGKIEG